MTSNISFLRVCTLVLYSAASFFHEASQEHYWSISVLRGLRSYEAIFSEGSDTFDLSMALKSICKRWLKIEFPFKHYWYPGANQSCLKKGGAQKYKVRYTVCNRCSPTKLQYCELFVKPPGLRNTTSLPQSAVITSNCACVGWLVIAC